jgi:nitrate/nitrite transporter NarK
MTTAERWIVMIVLGLSGTIIYLLPFLSEIFYKPLQQSLGITNTQVGAMMSVFGATSLVSYLLGGWAADRLQPRTLISSSLILTGFLGFAFATFPSYSVALFVHGLWGITVTGMMWCALIKATRDWAPASDQGKAFGFLEAVRGFSQAAIISMLIWVFAQIGGGVSAFANVVLIISALHIMLGVAAWFVITPNEQNNGQLSRSTSADFKAALSMPVVWLISVVIMASYSAYWGARYFTPYASEAFGLSVVAAAIIGTIKNWVRPIPAASAGYIADRFGIWQTVAFCFVALIVSFALFTLIPGNAGLVTIMIINIIFVSIFLFAQRGVYFALLEEGGIPPAITGSAIGVISMIGYSPDIFMPLIGGMLLDKYPGTLGYQLFFALIAGLCVIGLAAALSIGRVHKAKCVEC